MSSTCTNEVASSDNPAIVCTARAFTLERAFMAQCVIEVNMNRRPALPVIPLLEVSHDGSELLNFFCYISLTFRVDESQFSPMLEEHIASG